MPDFFYTMAQNHIEYHWPQRRETGGYVRVEAPDEATADSKMFMTFGRRWAFRYRDLMDIHPGDRQLLHVISKESTPNHADPHELS